jgi:hypothetical protein
MKIGDEKKSYAVPHYAVFYIAPLTEFNQLKFGHQHNPLTYCVDTLSTGLLSRVRGTRETLTPYSLCTSQILDPTAKIRIIAIFVTFSYEEHCAVNLFTCTWLTPFPTPQAQLKLFIAFRHQTAM